MKVVVIEEDRGLRDLIRPMLAERATTLVEVTTAADGPPVVGTVAPDVVLLAAVDLAGARREEVPRVLRRAHPTARLLLLGARPPSRGRPGPDVDGFLPYPFNSRQLNLAIDRLMEQIPAGSSGR